MYDYSEAKNALKEYLNGTKKAAEIKSFFSPYGIYQQKNDLFMMRIRINGGRLTAETLRNVIDIARFSKAAYLHFTTRQDIQLHDVAPEKIAAVMDLCSEKGLPFRGGGGDTFRNILTSPLSGIRKESAFDVLPYADELKQYLFSVDNAYALPRKIKIGLFDAPQDERFARVQDLGFLAEIRNGTKGFRVWGGGGIGRNSAEGILLFDFIPALDAGKAARAMVDLFFDRGNRKNRAEARIRYLVKELGAEEFVRLYQEYYKKADAPALIPMPVKKADRIFPKSFSANLRPGLDAWKRICTCPAGIEEESLVHIRIPHGNLRSRELEMFLWIMEKYSLSEYRLTPERTLYSIDFPTDALPALYDDLLKLLPRIDTTLKSFAGQIVTCIGCTVCKIGVLNSPELGNRVGKELDAYFECREEDKIQMANQILDRIRISGCPSCCTTHPTAEIGLNGLLKNGAKVWQFYTKSTPGQILGNCEPDVTPDDEASAKIMHLLNFSK